MLATEERVMTSTVTAETDEMSNMYLNFKLGDELFGIEIKHVLQIIGMQEITEMPEMSYAMKGFINMRGSVIPVVSLRLRFSMEEIEYTDRTCIVVVQTVDNEVGFIVDAIEETITIEPENVFPPPNSEEAGSSPFIMGVALLPDGDAVILVDAQKLL